MLIPAMRAMEFLCLALTLLVTRVRADDAHDALAPDHLAVAAHLLDRRCDFHALLSLSRSLGAKHDPRPRQVVRGQLDRHLVAREDADVVHPHLSRDVPEDDVAVLELDTKRGVGEILENLALHLDDVVFRHQPALKFAFFSSDSYCWLIT